MIAEFTGSVEGAPGLPNVAISVVTSIFPERTAVFCWLKSTV